MRKLRLPGLTAFFMVLAACGDRSIPAGLPIHDDLRLELKWVQDGFESPESAKLAPDGTLFVSNAAGRSDERNGAGFISRIATDGTVLDLRWADGLNAPKGIGMLNGVLYVSDIDRVVLFDIETGDRLEDIAVAGAEYLNDIAIWRGKVLVSDSRKAKIYRLTADGAHVFAASDTWQGINGLQEDGDRLLIVTMREGHLINYLGEGEYNILATGMANADGVGRIKGDGYLVSSWSGQIHYVSPEGEVQTLLDLQDQGIFQNDLNIHDDIVFVPNWVPGTITAWRIVRG